MIGRAGASDPLFEGGPMWRRAYHLINDDRRALLLPLVVTQLPAALLSSAALFVLLWRVFPEVDYQGLPNAEEQPRNYLLGLLLIAGAYWMFTLVGVAGTIIATRAIAAGEAVSLSSSLDPGFTRMGGLLVLGAILLGLVIATLFGLIVLLYVLWRFGLVLQQYLLGGSGPYGALGKSWLLLRGRMLRFAGMLLTLLPLSISAVAIGVFAGGLLALPLTFFEPSRALDLAGISIVGAVLGPFAVLVSAYIAVATTLFYLQVRAEADD